jgi:4-hydroxy-2-oxovalerate aldolase
MISTKKASKSPEILECTLRDGSYALDFQFTASDTFNIARRLDRLGFQWIEVGHGVGLGASQNGQGVAAATDVEYMESAAEAVRNGRWGMFCIPGIARVEDIEIAADHGMDFVRVGCEVTEVEEAKVFIEMARDYGLFVFSNLIKSYTSSVEFFVQQALKTIDYGAQCVYIVDSAGGMLPKEIGDYASALREVRPEIKIGFHGHNNLGMAVANSLFCADIGFDVIDSSLQGFGRSAGNAVTEQLVAALIRNGMDAPADPVATMEAGEELIRPLMSEVGISSLDVTSGLALFHSSYMRRVLDSAKQNRVDPRYLILELCKHDRINAPPQLIEACAGAVKSHGLPRGSLLLKSYFGEEQK